MSKRRAPGEDAGSAEDLDTQRYVQVTPLGAGSEVGRSCIILKYQGKTVMFDCGIHPGYSGMQSLPFLDEVDLASVDVALITHFHLDHCAAVPYLVRKTRFKGRLFMTHPTKVIYHSLLKDFAKAGRGSTDEQLYNEEDLDASMDKIELVDFHQTLEVGGIKITPYRAGHVIGAAMFMVDIAGMKCLYTGDYSREPDRHLPIADLPPMKPHVVIIESTYGTSNHTPRLAREAQFLNTIVDTLGRGGRVLLPVVALGRAQELLLILEEFWASHPELQKIPIYQTSTMMGKAMSVYQTYVEMMNDDIKAVFHDHNPFEFKHIDSKTKPTSILHNSGQCVVMATPSGLQSGTSRDFFEAWCEDSKNSCIICDFAVQNTLARDIQSNPKTVLARDGRKLHLRMSVHHISFSAHADCQQTCTFLDEMAPPHVVLVHGEANGMRALARELTLRAKRDKMVREVHTPTCAQAVSIEHRPERVARLLGRLAEKPPREGQPIRGLLIQEGFSHQLLHPDDLPAYTKLFRGRVTQRQAIMVDKPFSHVRLALEVMFEGVEGSGRLPVSGLPSSSAEEPESVLVGNQVTVTHQAAETSAGPGCQLVVEWEGGQEGDMVADAVVAVILQAAGEPAAASHAEAARRSALATGDTAAVALAELQLVAALMQCQFGAAVVDKERGLVTVQVDQHTVVISHASGKVVSSDAGLRGRVQKAVERLMLAMRPCPLEVDD